jgi:spore germination cell wall hydrolase CwlJ-like protein
VHYVTILQDILIAFIKKITFYVIIGFIIYGAISSNNKPVEPITRHVNHHNSSEFIDLSRKDLRCMSETVYGEARGESQKGQLMVVNVIMNRVLSDKYPNNICDVVKQKKQFSVWNNGAFPINHKIIYNEIENDIIDLFDDYYDLTDGATWYHADYVNPKWTRDLKRVIKVGKHIFYKEKED